MFAVQVIFPSLEGHGLMCICSAQVGHVQRVSLVPDRTHNMRTLSLKPLLFGEFTQIHFHINCKFWFRHQLQTSKWPQHLWPEMFTRTTVSEKHLKNFNILRFKNIGQGSSIIYVIMNTEVCFLKLYALHRCLFHLCDAWLSSRWCFLQLDG